MNINSWIYLFGAIFIGLPYLIITLSSIFSKNKDKEVEIRIVYDKVENKYFVQKDYICVACKDTFEEAKKFVDDNREILKQNKDVLYKEKI